MKITLADKELTTYECPACNSIMAVSGCRVGETLPWAVPENAIHRNCWACGYRMLAVPAKEHHRERAFTITGKVSFDFSEIVQAETEEKAEENFNFWPTIENAERWVSTCEIDTITSDIIGDQADDYFIED